MTRRELHEKISETFEPYPFTWTDGGVRVVPDFDTDEAANAMLLEAMPSPALSKYPENRGIRHDPALWWCDWDTDTSDVTPIGRSDRKIAIVDAYAKWKGLL